MAKKYQIPHVYATYQALLADPTLEAVYILLPNSLHTEWSLRALRAFVQAIRGERALPTGAADGLANMRVIDAV